MFKNYFIAHLPKVPFWQPLRLIFNNCNSLRQFIPSTLLNNILSRITSREFDSCYTSCEARRGVFQFPCTIARYFPTKVKVFARMTFASLGQQIYTNHRRFICSFATVYKFKVREVNGILSKLTINQTSVQDSALLMKIITNMSGCTWTPKILHKKCLSYVKLFIGLNVT